jgi:hypothetical protein
MPIQPRVSGRANPDYPCTLHGTWQHGSMLPPRRLCATSALAPACVGETASLRPTVLAVNTGGLSTRKPLLTRFVAHCPPSACDARSGFTFNIPNDGCPTPDCDANCGVYFCKQTSEELWWKCGWRGDQLKAMLTMHARLRHNGAFRIGGNEVTYNEVVIDTAGYFGTMPRSVAAFFYTAKANPEQRASARKAHERFLAKYGGLAKGTPLLVYDSSKRGEPFSTAEAGE